MGVVVVGALAWGSWSLWWPGSGGATPAEDGAPSGHFVTGGPTEATWARGPGERVTIPRLEVDAELSEYTAAEAAQGYDEVADTSCLVSGVIVCVDPTSTTGVVWQRGGANGIGFGSKPSADAEQNVYLFGHADDAGTAVFSRLAELAVGDEIGVTADGSDLTYTVDQVVTVDKADYTSLPEAVEQVPGRLLLVSCDHTETAPQGNGWALDNVVVVAHLSDERSR